MSQRGLMEQTTVLIMAAKLSRILVFALAFGLFSVILAADTRRISVKGRLNVGAPEELVNSTAGQKSGLDLDTAKDVGNFKILIKDQIVAFTGNEIIKSTGERDNRLNVIAPEEIDQLADSVRNNYDPETAYKLRGNKVLNDSGLNLGVPGDLESRDLFGGDIILTPEQAKDWNTRKAVTFDWNLWPRKFGFPTVYYTIGNTKVPESTIQEAIAHYKEHTCIRFTKTFWLFHIGPQIVFKDGSGCSSMVGRQFLNFFGGQGISLAEGCNSLPTVVHEIGHAVGLYHEQSRSDRDAYIKVIPGNIVSGMEHNFNKESTKNYETTYDYTSVMQYGPLSFSSNGDTTLAATDPMAHGLMILSRPGFSFMDKLILNRMYGCVDQWVSQCSGISSDPCKNMGYLGPDCNCVCPAGTSGTNCETKTKSYTDALIEVLLPLSERVTSPGTISSPNYPTPQLPSMVFTKIITAPTGQIVKLTVIGFTLFQRYSSLRCSSEGVEIRLGDPVTSGKWYCGSELKTGDTLQSEGNTLVLFYIKGRMDSNDKAGFSFAVTFQPASSGR